MMISLALPFAIYAGYVYSLTPYGDGSIGATIRYKIDLLKETEGERIILVGGSSSPYGTICEDFEEVFDKPCINIGATAYLGLEYYINILENHARKGDTVVIGPEHILLQAESIDYTTVWIAIGEDWDAISLLPVSYYSGLFSTFKNYSGLRIADKDVPYGVRIHPYFGPKGDVIIERESILQSGYNREDIVQLSEDKIYWDNLDLINKFTRFAAKKGITVCFAFAPLNRLAVSSSDEQNRLFASSISDYIEAPIVVDFDTSIMNCEYFYDSNNHLTSAGAKIYTANMIEGLKKVLS